MCCGYIDFGGCLVEEQFVVEHRVFGGKITGVVAGQAIVQAKQVFLQDEEFAQAVLLQFRVVDIYYSGYGLIAQVKNPRAYQPATIAHLYHKSVVYFIGGIVKQGSQFGVGLKFQASHIAAVQVGQLVGHPERFYLYGEAGAGRYYFPGTAAEAHIAYLVAQPENRVYLVWPVRCQRMHGEYVAPPPVPAKGQVIVEYTALYGRQDMNVVEHVERTYFWRCKFLTFSLKKYGGVRAFLQRLRGICCGMRSAGERV